MGASTIGNACPQPADIPGAPVAENCLFLQCKFFPIFLNLNPSDLETAGAEWRGQSHLDSGKY